MTNAPSVDLVGFSKRLTGAVVVLAFFHLFPVIYPWVSEQVFGQGVVIDPRRYRFILIVVWALLGLAALLEFASIVWVLVRRRRGS